VAKYAVKSIGIPNTLIPKMIRQGLLPEGCSMGTPENLFLHYHKDENDEDGTFALTLERNGDIFILDGGLANKWGPCVVRVTGTLRGVVYIGTTEEIKGRSE
jgi:hypothetical protein